MTNNTIKKLIEELRSVKSLSETNRKKQYWYNTKRTIQKSDSELKDEFLKEYSRVTNSLDTDDRADIGVERDENDKIQYYTFEIYKKGRLPLVGKLDRREMETIYNLYSTYGANLTQKIVSREFPQYSFVDFKRILRAFNIYKYDLAPKHLLEELSEDELRERQCRIKENNVTRKLEKDQLAEANKIINKLATELNSFKSFKEFNIKIDANYTPKIFNNHYECDKTLVLHISDTHVGASLSSTSLFNNNWDEEEFIRRLDELIINIHQLGPFNKIVINLLGDYLDGMDGMTARRDHVMPQNMDNKKQFNVFVNNMLHFLVDIHNITNLVEVYAVPEGNHGGFADYFAIKALEYATNAVLPEVKFVVFERYFGIFNVNSHTYLSMHGK